MSVARILCRAQVGLAAPRVDTEVHLGAGLPCFNIVGLPATEVKESKERVRAALVNSGFEFPAGRITVNLAPADLPKDGGRFDLAIAIGILVASGQLVPRRELAGLEFLGELGLSGELRAVRGALPAAAAAAALGHRVVLPVANAGDLRWFPAFAATAAADLLAVCGWLGGHDTAAVEVGFEPSAAGAESPQPQLADVCGQPRGKLALEVAAAGGHSLLLIGPPGCGKTMLAERLRSLLPPLEPAEAQEVAMIASLTAPAVGVVAGRPFRAPHHTASANAIIGGGPGAGPGEVTLAHRGILFLDELPEFDRRVLESLREPLETGRVAIARVGAQADYPAGFQLVAAMNPCPCGFSGSLVRRCQCKAAVVERYRARLSGPLLDRLDLRVELDVVSNADLAEHRRAATRARACAGDHEIRERVLAARVRQRDRQGCLNAALSGPRLIAAANIGDAAERALLRTREAHGTSLRAHDRLVRVARTLADLRGNTAVSEQDVADAASLRRALS
jgi:magnesium chelatase family protein